ncbi:SurA N-terminal domain-containing protein [Elongatibacter sediminis]|uniref:Periplasmic chaperone PpiD n=1 Tax=Elongatibacter sediminis TaxID=3119006 RepID=A0AAW9RDD1_9GAMM
MLQAIRERLSGILAVFILGILVVPFALVGVSSYFQPDAVNAVARVNDVEITQTEYTQSFQNYRRRMQSLLGANFDAEQFDQPVVRRQHLESLINQELLSQVSLETGLAVDDQRLAEAIRNIPAFQVDGEFNHDVYQSRLLAQGSTPQQFENDMRAQLILDQYPGTIASSAIATDWELREYVRLHDQEREFEALIVPAVIDGDEGEPVGEMPETGEEAVAAEDDTAAPEAANEEAAGEAVSEPVADSEPAMAADLSEEALVTWYEANQQDYRSPEQVIIEFIELDASALEQDVAPSEDELRARFEEQQARFITPEARLASHILLEVAPDADEAAVETVREKAADLAQQARDGADFAELARTYSEDAGSASLGGDLDWVEPGFMVQAFEDALYELSLESPVSEPIQTGFGWHVILLRDVRPAEGMSFEEARDTLMQELVAEQQERRFLEQADRLIDIIYEDPTTLLAAGEELGLTIQEAGPFGRDGGTGIAANPDVVSTAFSDLVLQQGSVSDPVDLGENHIVLMRLNEYIPESIRPLEEVRDEVIAAVRQDRAMQAAAERAESLMARITDGADMTALATDEGLERVSAEAATRNSTDLPAGLVGELFRLQPPSDDAPRVAIIELDQAYAVVRLTAVRDGELSDDELIQQQTQRRRIANAAASAEAFGFIRMLRSQSEIDIYEDRL